MIESFIPADHERAESALYKLNSGKVGSALLQEIKNLTVDGKFITIKVSYGETSAIPRLTQKQALLHGVSESPTDREHNDIATRLPQKLSFGRKGQGVGSLVFFNPKISAKIVNGIPERDEDESVSFVSLGHELIHSYRMMKGTFTGGLDNRYDFNSRAYEEEARAVGIGVYGQEPITENAIRAEHGLPLRAQYASKENQKELDPLYRIFG